jgi:hypothetical protein
MPQPAQAPLRSRQLDAAIAAFRAGIVIAATPITTQARPIHAVSAIDVLGLAVKQDVDGRDTRLR